MTRSPRRAAPDEYADFYATYLDVVPDGDIVEVLRAQGETSAALLRSIPAEREEYRYEAGKWTLKGVVGHVIDGEWVFTNRVLRFARADQTELPGMDQDVFAAGSNVGARSLSSLAEEWRHLRLANVALFDSFDDAILDRRGTASGCGFTVRAMLGFLAGHAVHHMRVLRERYL